MICTGPATRFMRPAKVMSARKRDDAARNEKQAEHPRAEHDQIAAAIRAAYRILRMRRERSFFR